MVKWPWHALSPTLSQSLNCALFLMSLLLYSFMSCLSSCVPHSPSLPLSPSQEACKGALIERYINLRVTNSSWAGVGDGVYLMNRCTLKRGPPRLLCHLRFLLALLWDSTTSQPEPQHCRQAVLRPGLMLNITEAPLWLWSDQLQDDQPQDIVFYLHRIPVYFHFSEFLKCCWWRFLRYGLQYFMILQQDSSCSSSDSSWLIARPWHMVMRGSQKL